MYNFPQLHKYSEKLVQWQIRNTTRSFCVLQISAYYSWTLHNVNLAITRKHSSRMRTARFQTVRASVATTRCHFQGRGSSSEQIWTGVQCWPLDVISRVWVPKSDVGGGGAWTRWALHSEVQGIMGNGNMGTPPTVWQTHVRTLPSHNFVAQWEDNALQHFRKNINNTQFKKTTIIDAVYLMYLWTNFDQKHGIITTTKTVLFRPNHVLSSLSLFLLFYTTGCATLPMDTGW